jgi:hypothetical protein
MGQDLENVDNFHPGFLRRRRFGRRRFSSLVRVSHAVSFKPKIIL